MTGTPVTGTPETGIEIVKRAVDVGLATNRLDEHRTFWEQEVGLGYDHLLKVGGGVHQHRYDLHGAVLKLNAHRDPLQELPTGFASLAIVVESLREEVEDQDPRAAPVQMGETRSLTTPDGTPVELVPGLGGGTRTAIRLEATDADHTARVIHEALGAARSGRSCIIGETRIEVLDAPDRRPTHQRDGTGIRYLTVQVRDVESAHAHALDHGCSEGLAPVRLGDVAYISFVRLPDGDWVELSQRASLTGPLPDDAPPA